MDKKVTCCGMVCDDCEYLSEDCEGCMQSKGKPFWMQFADEDSCDIYDCCTDEHSYRHCGQCDLLPCTKYTQSGGDPTVSPDENIEILELQLAQLHELNEQEEAIAK